MRKREMIDRIEAALVRVDKEISGNRGDGNVYARGLSMEGYAGGYRDALHAVLALVTHGYPSDQRGYWQKLERK